MLARTDETLATALATAAPVDDAGLEAGIQALSRVLSGAKSKLPAEAQADQRLAEAPDLCTALQSMPGTVHTSKGQTVADTVQIDLYDGKLYVWMRDLNQAARRAIRNGNLNAGLQDYAFHHLKRSGNPAPPTPAPQTQATPQTHTAPQPT